MGGLVLLPPTGASFFPGQPLRIEMEAQGFGRVLEKQSFVGL